MESGDWAIEAGEERFGERERERLGEREIGRERDWERERERFGESQVNRLCSDEISLRVQQRLP